MSNWDIYQHRPPKSVNINISLRKNNHGFMTYPTRKLVINDYTNVYKEQERYNNVFNVSYTTEQDNDINPLALPDFETWSKRFKNTVNPLGFEGFDETVYVYNDKEYTKEELREVYSSLPEEPTLDEIESAYKFDQDTWHQSEYKDSFGVHTKPKKISMHDWLQSFLPTKWVNHYEQKFIERTDNPVKDIPRLSSLVEKGVTEGKGWSAPIVIFDTETTSLGPNRQTVNIAALKVRYNFKTSKWAILDTYERYYYPDFEKWEYRKYNREDAIDIYNQSEAVRLHGLTTSQIEHNRQGYNKIISDTFNTKEQEAFVKWLVADNQYPVITGNNILFDAPAINNAFVKYTGYNPTYLDLMDIAQSTPSLQYNLENYRSTYGKGGLSVQSLYERFVSNNYKEQHFAGQDVVDEFAILKALTNRVRMDVVADGWDKLKAVMKQDSPFTSKWVDHEWNLYPIKNTIDTAYSNVKEILIEDLKLSPDDAGKVITKWKAGKLRPGTLGYTASHNLKLNKESAVMNILMHDVHKMTKEQRKEYREYIKQGKIKKWAGDTSVLETTIFKDDDFVNNGFVNYDYAPTYTNKAGDTIYSESVENAGFSVLSTDSDYSDINTKNVLERLASTKISNRSINYLINKTTDFIEERNAESMTMRQILETSLIELSRNPKYRGKFYVDSNLKLAAFDPADNYLLRDVSGGTYDDGIAIYSGNRRILNREKKYGTIWWSTSSEDERIRRLYMNTIFSNYLKKIKYAQRTGEITEEQHVSLLEKAHNLKNDEEKLFFTWDNELDKIIKANQAPPYMPWKETFERNSYWNKTMSDIHDSVSTGLAKKTKFSMELENRVRRGEITDNAANAIFTARYTYGRSDNDIASMLHTATRDKEVNDYLASQDANDIARREAEVKVAEQQAAKERAYEEAYLNRRSSDKYAMRSMREGLGDRVDYLINHGKISKGTADAILSQFDAQVASGTGSMEAFEKALNKATKEIDKNVVSQQKATKAWESMIKPTDFNAVYQAGYAQINGTLGAASGVLPNFVMNPMRRAGAAVINGFEIDRARYNYYARTAGMIKNNLSVAGAVLGSFVPGLGAVPGMAIGAGIGEVGTSIYNQMMWRKERRINETGNIVQNSLNTVGFLKSISGLDIAFSALTKTVKWATLGFVGMVTKGLHSMQSLGNPITQLSGVGYSDYQVYGRMDRMFGFSNGTINSSIENFALQQRRMYTYGQMDIDRIVAASMLGVFGNVYANGGDPKKNYEDTVNKIASGGITDTKISWAAMIDKTLPQILQIMKDMNANNLQDVYRQSGVSFYELTDEGRKTMRKTSFGYRTALSNMSTMWQVMGASMWNNGLDKIFERVTKWLELIANKSGVWLNSINPLIESFDKLFDALKEGDKDKIESAMNGVKKAFGDILSVIRDPLVKMVSGISVAMMSAIQTMLPSISKMIQSLISEISQFNFDKDALMSNINNGTNFPVIRYGEQKGQFRYLGNSEYERQKFDKIVNNDDLTTEQKKIQLGYAMPNTAFQKKKWVNTEDYTPLTAVDDANKAISGIANDVASGDIINKVMKAFMDAFEKAMKVDITVSDKNTGNSSHGFGNENISRDNWYARISAGE